MKLAFLFILLNLISLSSFAYEKGNGGGPYEVEAVMFPDYAFLEKSTNEVIYEVGRSCLPDVLKDRVSAELAHLVLFRAYRFINREIVVPASGRYGVISSEFEGLSAWTGRPLGSEVFLTKSALEIDQRSFNKLLLHETFHHVIPITLSDDETFVIDLANMVIEGSCNDDLLSALSRGVLIRDDKLFVDQVIEAWDFATPNQKWWCDEVNEKDEQIQGHCEVVTKRSLGFILADRFVIQDGIGIYSLEIDVFSTHLYRELSRLSRQKMSEGTFKKSFRDIMVKRSLELNPFMGKVKAKTFGHLFSL